jgi:DNA repair exonuclease SbcCD ATPase subunit
MTTSSNQRLEEAIAASKATCDRWAAQQKTVADRMTAEAAARFAEFEKRMEASQERLLALQHQRGLRMNNDDEKNPAIEEVQNEIHLRMSKNETLEAVLADKTSAIDCKNNFCSDFINVIWLTRSVFCFSFGRGTCQARSRHRAATGREGNE